jgi:hypothetical protein
MKIPRDLSGEQLVRGLCSRWDYRRIHQVGSHIILETETPTHQRLSIPTHKTVMVEHSGAYSGRSQHIRMCLVKWSWNPFVSPNLFRFLFAA